MNSFVVNKNSWHYRLNMKVFPPIFESTWQERHNNFCAYWRATGLRLLALAFFALIITGLLILIYLKPWESLKVFLFVLATFSGAALVVGIAHLINKWIIRDKVAKPPGLFKQKYLAWKENYCPMVEYKDG